MRVHFDDVIFWVSILAIIGISLWMLHGSPTDAGAIVGIGIFVVTSELVVWRHMFKVEKDTSVGFVKMEKKTAVGFEKVRSEFRDVRKDLRLMESNIMNKLDGIGR